MSKKESLPRTWLEKGLFGNQLHMYCDLCNREIVVKVGGLGGFLSSIAGTVISSVAGYTAGRITDGVGRHMLSKEAESLVRKYMHQCPKCGRWVGDECWNESQGLCKACTGEFSGTPYVEPIFAISEETVKQVSSAMEDLAKSAAIAMEKTAHEIQTAATIICPHCGQPTPPGKFCANCGQPLVIYCPNCGAPVPATAKFCPNCGAKLRE
ncbi:MAG: zinc-ribbon domain-containing protein [Candidatus Asgardarchaeia archaeon]